MTSDGAVKSCQVRVIAETTPRISVYILVVYVKNFATDKQIIPFIQNSNDVKKSFVLKLDSSGAGSNFEVK